MVMATAYIIALILVLIGGVLFGVGWKKSQTSEVYVGYAWQFFGIVGGIVGGLVAVLQLILP
jgi:hypothetical protein